MTTPQPHYFVAALVAHGVPADRIYHIPGWPSEVTAFHRGWEGGWQVGLHLACSIIGDAQSGDRPEDHGEPGYRVEVCGLDVERFRYFGDDAASRAAKMIAYYMREESR